MAARFVSGGEGRRRVVGWVVVRVSLVLVVGVEGKEEE